MGRETPVPATHPEPCLCRRHAVHVAGWGDVKPSSLEPAGTSPIRVAIAWFVSYRSRACSPTSVYGFVRNLRFLARVSRIGIDLIGWRALTMRSRAKPRSMQ